MKIILTGYRATGKSTVGKLLAGQLRLRFVDTDRALEEAAGCSIRELVTAKGWDFFRAREKELLLSLVGKDQLVIAAGGGAILHTDVWRQLMREALAVWLTADPAIICRRLEQDLRSPGQRPSLTGKDIREEIEEVLAARALLYEQGSHMCIETTHASLQEIAIAIATAAQKRERGENLSSE